MFCHVIEIFQEELVDDLDFGIPDLMDHKSKCAESNSGVTFSVIEWKPHRPLCERSCYYKSEDMALMKFHNQTTLYKWLK